MRARRFILTTIAALYFGALIGLAFVPGSASNRMFWFWPFAAFVPVGLLLLFLLGRRRWWAAIVFGMLGAAWLEAAQSVWMPPGYAESMDVLWASLGVAVGVGAGVVIRALTMASRSIPMRVHESPRIVPHAGRREIPQD